jgi:predicted CoA-binding protein
MSQNETNEILKKYKVLAVVGLSDDTTKPSFMIASYLKRAGYHIIPVNPAVSRILGENCYNSLLAIPPRLQQTIDIVSIFRRSEDVLPVVQQAVELKRQMGRPFVIWMQEGIVNEVAAETARRAGLVVIMDRCLLKEHKRLRSAQ